MLSGGIQYFSRRMQLGLFLSVLASATWLTKAVSPHGDTPAPDLQITDVDINGGAPLYWGDTVVVRWTIANTGALSVNEFWDRLTVTNLLTSEKLVQKSVLYDPTLPGNHPLHPGQSIEKEHSFPLAVLSEEGELSFQFLTDSSAKYAEQNSEGTGESNNETNLVRVVKPRPVPDLVVAEVEAPAAVDPGQETSVTWVVSNLGAAPATNIWYDAVSLRPASGTGDVQLGSLIASGALAPGQSVTNTQTVSISGTLTPGTYFVVVRTDIGNSVVEDTGETNNTTVSPQPTEVLPPRYPDLLVTNLIVPSEAVTDQPVPVRWTIMNLGDAPATNAWTDRVYLSTDVQAGADRTLGSYAYSEPLAPGESVERTQLVTVPRSGTVEGPYWLLVVTDVDRHVNEGTNETNNTQLAAQSTAVRFSHSPNLKVLNVAAPSTAYAGLETVIEWAVTNAGTASTSARMWEDTLWLSANTTWDAADAYLGRTNNATFLDVGNAYHNSLAVTLPPAIQGRFYVIVRTDERDNVEEYTAENDNTKASGAVQVTIPPAPDLRILDAHAPTVAFADQEVSVTYSVINHGTAALNNGTWYDTVYLSTNDVLDAMDQYTVFVRRQGSLETGQVYTHTIRARLDPDFVGNSYLIVLADVGNRVEEQVNEGNNTAAVPIEIKPVPPPDLEVQITDAPVEARGGYPLTLTYRVANRGPGATPRQTWTDALYLSPDDTYQFGKEHFLKSQMHHGALEAGQDYTNSFEVTAPFLNGPFYALIRTDADDNLEELDKTNNVAVSAEPLQMLSIPADLRVGDFQAPNTARTDGTLLLSWKVINDGPADTLTNQWEDRLILSRDDVEGNEDDFVIGHVPHGGMLLPGEEYEVTHCAVKMPASFGPGAHTLWIAVDKARIVYDETRTNNYVMRGLTLVGGMPDLQVELIEHPAIADAGSPLIAWTIKNFGDGPTRSDWWIDRVYLSVDGALDASDILVSETTHANPLAAGEFYQDTNSFGLDPITPGTYYVIVDTDCSQRVDESDAESNNARASDSPLVIPVPPDLTVLQVNAPTEAVSGQPFQVTFVITNLSGRKAEGLWNDAVYLSADQIFDRATDQPAGWAVRPRDLLKGESYAQTIEATVPDGISGPAHVFVVSDLHDLILESGLDSNNRDYDRVSMMIRLQPPVDLVAGMVTIPTHVLAGQLAAFTYRVVNQGVHPATGRWTDALYLSADPVWDIDDALMGRVNHDGDVLPGGAYTNAVSAALPGLAPGTYYVIVRSDILNRVPENDERNNFAASLEQAVLDVAELALNTPVTLTLSKGQAAFYKLNTESGQTLEILLDSEAQVGFNELYVRFGTPPDRTQFDWIHEQPNEPSQRIVVPATQAGTYYLMVYANSTERLPTACSLVARCLDFGVSDVEPAAGGNVGEVTVRIDGALFDSKTRVELVGPDRTLRAAWTEYVDPTRILATFDLRGAPPGSYDLRAVSEKKDMVYFKPTEEAIEYMAVYGDCILPAAFEVLEGGGPECHAELLLPVAARLGRPFPIYLEVINRGNTDMPVPVYVISSPNRTPLAASMAELRSPRGSGGTKEHIMVLGSVRPLVLVPGERVRVPLYASAVQSAGAEFVLRRLSTNAGPVDWAAWEPFFRDYGDPNWSQTWTSFLAMAGTTWADLESALRTMAGQLARHTGARFFTGEYVFQEMLARAYAGLPLVPPATQPNPAKAAAACCAGDDLLERVFVDRATGLPRRVGPVGLHDISRPSNLGAATLGRASSPRLHGKGSWWSWCKEHPEDCRWWGCFDTSATFWELMAAETAARVCATVGIGTFVHPGIVFIWLAYLASTPETPVPEMVIYETVGTPLDFVGLAFGQSDAIEEEVATSLKSHVINAIPNQEFSSCYSIPGTYNLEKFLGWDPEDPEYEAIVTNDLVYRQIFRPNINFGKEGYEKTIPGNLAGGKGEGCGREDERIVRGSVRLSPVWDKCGRIVTLRVMLDTHWTVKDCVDLCPGDPGKGWEQLCTRPMTVLEANGWAYDVPFTVKFSHYFSFTSPSPFSECQGKCRQIPPDPCSETCGCKEGDTGYPPFIPDCGPKHVVPPATATDPNDLTGPAGFGPERWVTATQPLPYTIHFENDPLYANAPAQVVQITQQLDPGLDWRSFRLGSFGFGDQLIEVPANRAYYQARLDLRATHGVLLDVVAGVDVVSGLAFWQFASADPLTGGLPVDPMAGFLPPNLVSPEGEGFVTYSIRPRQEAATGTRIAAQAQIIFDLNLPIDTPFVFNTLDADLPTSTLEPLPNPIREATFALDWSGRDDPNGSGVAGYDIFVSIDGRPLELLLDQTTLNGTLVAGQAGHSYAFYGRARDNAGNVEALRSVPDAQTVLPDPAPYLWPIPSQTADEDTAVGPLSITVQDTQSAVDQLAFQVSSSNPALLSPQNVLISGSGNNRVVHLAPASNQFGSVTLTLTVRNTTHSATQSFELTVRPVNDPPLAFPDELLRPPETTLRVPADHLLRNDADVEGADLTVVAVARYSANGVLLDLKDGWITYHARAGDNRDDRFTYTVSDADGGSAAGVVFVSVDGMENGVSRNRLILERQVDGRVVVQFVGLPDKVYAVEATDDVTSPRWVELISKPTDAGGWFEFVDTDVPVWRSRFYRTVTTTGP